MSPAVSSKNKVFLTLALCSYYSHAGGPCLFWHPSSDRALQSLKLDNFACLDYSDSQKAFPLPEAQPCSPILALSSVATYNIATTSALSQCCKALYPGMLSSSSVPSTASQRFAQGHIP